MAVLSKNIHGNFMKNPDWIQIGKPIFFFVTFSSVLICSISWQEAELVWKYGGFYTATTATVIVYFRPCKKYSGPVCPGVIRLWELRGFSIKDEELVAALSDRSSDPPMVVQISTDSTPR